MAFHNYHDVFNKFPADGLWVHEPTNDTLRAPRNFSWICAILPYIDQAPLYNQINFSIPALGQNLGGKTLESIELVATRCPSDPGYVPNPPHGLGWTYYGVPTSWDPWVYTHDPRILCMFSNSIYLSIRDVVDGTSNTVMCGETDSSNFTGSQFPGQGRRRVAGERVFRANLLSTQTWDGHYYMDVGVWYPPVPNRKFVLPDGTPASSLPGIGYWWRAGPYALAPVYYTAYGPQSEWPGPSSFHVGGSHFLMSDGSVRFIGTNIQHSGDWTQSLYQAIHSPNGANAQVNVSDF